MVTISVPCDLEEDSVLSDLRELVLEYDDLYDLCLMTRLSPEDQKTLDELYGCLLVKEYEYWDGVPGDIVELVSERFDFPMIRFTLGMLPSED